MWCWISASLRPPGRLALPLLLVMGCALALAGGLEGEPLLLAVRVNGAEVGETTTVWRLPDGSLNVAEQDWLAWRLKAQDLPRSQIDGRAHIRLAEVPGLTYRIDGPSQTLVLSVPAAWFTPTELSYGADEASDLTPSRPGGFFNYDLAWQSRSGRGSGGGLFELGLFNGWGSGTTTALWRDSPAGRRQVRLDSTWTLDRPQRMERWRLGDSISRGGSWGRSVRFGGVQWSTDFAVRPDFVPYPRPGLAGEAVLPSTLDVYLDNVHVWQSDVPPGPFELANLPVMSGQGEVRLVVEDLLGRQQVIEQSYHTSPQLLRPGLRDFSYELGAIREDYGLANAHYGRSMLVATDRLGVRPDFTREWRAELTSQQQAVGAAGVWLVPPLQGIHVGTLNFAAAASHSPAGRGTLLSLGLERRTRGISFSGQVQHASREFAQIGQRADQAPRQRLVASLGIPLGGRSLGLGFVRQTLWAGDDHRLLSASYSMRLGRSAQLGLYAVRSNAANNRLHAGVILTMAVDDRTTLSADVGRRRERTRYSLQAQRNLPAGDGWGYRLQARDGGMFAVAASLRSPYADVVAEAVHTGGAMEHRASVSGGVALAGGGLMLTRSLGGSFAVVQVADYAGVRVYRDHQEVARTNARGLALVTDLRAYQKNPIEIEQADLPLEADVGALKLVLTPALRSGVVADFPVRSGRGASLRLLGPGGVPLPPGTPVRVDGDERTFPVGFDGRLFVNRIRDGLRLSAEWNGRRCGAHLPQEAIAEGLSDLGNVVCEGVER